MTQEPSAPRRSIPEVYAGQRVLLTGASGFLGKVLLASLLEHCPDLAEVVVILRADGAQALRDRFLRDIFASPAFDRLRDRHGLGLLAFLERKVRLVRGDLGLPGAGLSPEDLDLVTKDLDLVVHCAGLVDFVPPLDKALSVNVDGTLECLALARRAGPGRAAFVHVSTCFVCGLSPGQHPEELAPHDYPARTRASFEGFDVAAELEQARRLVAKVKKDELEDPLVQAALHEEAEGSPRKVKRLADLRMRRRMVEVGLERANAWGWPNTYTYTKALAERVVWAARGDLGPVTIVRPAVVESAMRFPFPGWNQGVNTSAPLVWMTAQGQRYWPTTDQFFLDVIPVDHVVHALVMIGANALEARRPTGPALPPVFQLGTSDVNPFAMRRVIELAALVYRENPDQSDSVAKKFLRSHFEAMGVDERVYRALGLPTTAKVARGLRGLLDRVPPPDRSPRLASLLDRVKGAVRDASRDLDKAEQIVSIYLPFIATCPVTFRCDRARALFAALSPEDRARFPYDPEAIDWREYWTRVHIPGLERWAFPQLRLQEGGGPTDFEPTYTALTDLLEDRARFGRIVCWRRLDAQGQVAARVTYEEALTRSKAAAARLVADGVRPHDRVVLVSENQPAWGLGYFGALFAGATAVPVESGMEAARVLVLVRASRAKVVLLSEAARAAVGAELEALLAAEGLPARVRALEALTAPAARGEDLPPIPPDQALVPRPPASLIYTSGTTGAPKGVLLSHEAFCKQVRAIASLFQIGGEDRILSVLPLHHAFEFSAGFLLPLYGGATVTYLAETTAEGVRAGVEVVKPTAMIGVPALFEAWHRRVRRQVKARGAGAERAFEALLAFHRGVRARANVNLGKRLFPEVHAAFGGALRFVVSGGSALPREVELEFEGLGIDIFQGYGMTEAAPVLTSNRPGEARLGGSVGRPIPEVEVKIREPDGEGVGEIVARTPCLFSGYDGDPEQTARTVVDGWLRTGDLGRLDEHGHLYVVGRLKDAIVDAAGNTVHPDEVEDLYAGCADVVELAVVGVPGRAEQHEVVGALVVPRADGEGGVEGARERVREFVRVTSEGIPFPKRIKVLQFTSRPLPRTATRKVRRAEVARTLAELVRAGDRGPASRRGKRPGRGTDAVVARVFEDLAGVDPARLAPEAHLAQDLGLDSIALAEVALSLAEAFGKPAPRALERVVTVADLLALFEQTGEGGARVEPVRADARPLVLPAPVQQGVSGLLDGLQALGYGQALGAKVTGAGNIPHHTNAIVVANHASHLDVGLVKHALGPWGAGLVSAGARDYFFQDTLRATYFANFTNVIPFDRHASVRESLERFVELLRQGKTVLIFPEGTRSVTGRMASFKPGLGLLVQTARVGILPVYLSGTWQSMPKGAFLPRRRPLEARIGAFMPADRLLGLTGHLPRRQQALRIVDAARAALCSLRDGVPFDLAHELADPTQLASEPPSVTAAQVVREVEVEGAAIADRLLADVPAAGAPEAVDADAAAGTPRAVAALVQSLDTGALDGAGGDGAPPAAGSKRTRRNGRAPRAAGERRSRGARQSPEAQAEGPSAPAGAAAPVEGS